LIGSMWIRQEGKGGSIGKDRSKRMIKMGDTKSD
jgi:hypothetical protein